MVPARTASTAAFWAIHAPVLTASWTPWRTRFAMNSPVYIAIRAMVSDLLAIIAAVLLTQAAVFLTRSTVIFPRDHAAVAAFQAMKVETTPTRTGLDCTICPRNPRTVCHTGEEPTSMMKLLTPGITLSRSVPHRLMTVSRTEMMKSTRPESSWTPKKDPLKSPVATRVARFSTPGTSVPLIQFPAAAAASRTLKRKSTTPESSSRPNGLPWKSPLTRMS